MADFSIQTSSALSPVALGSKLPSGAVLSTLFHSCVVLSLWSVGAANPTDSAGQPKLVVVISEEPQTPDLETLGSKLDLPIDTRSPRPQSFEPILTKPLQPLLAWKPSNEPPIESQTNTLDETAQAARRSEQLGRAVEFFGTRAYGKRFVFVLDASGSMDTDGRFGRATRELLDAIDCLDNQQEFLVLLFREAVTPMFGQADMLTATEENKQRLEEWFYGVSPVGFSDPRGALNLSLEVDADAVFLLSDGEFKTPGTKINSRTLRWLGHKNKERTPIHTIAFEDKENARTLQAVARDSGGTYRFVPQL